MAKSTKLNVDKSARLQRMRAQLGKMSPGERANLPKAQQQVAYDDLVHGPITLKPKSTQSTSSRPRGVKPLPAFDRKRQEEELDPNLRRRAYQKRSK